MNNTPNFEVDGLQQLKTTQVSIPDSQEQKSEAAVETG